MPDLAQRNAEVVRRYLQVFETYQVVCSSTARADMCEDGITQKGRF